MYKDWACRWTCLVKLKNWFSICFSVLSKDSRVSPHCRVLTCPDMCLLSIFSWYGTCQQCTHVGRTHALSATSQHINQNGQLNLWYYHDLLIFIIQWFLNERLTSKGLNLGNRPCLGLLLGQYGVGMVFYDQDSSKLSKQG